MRTAKILVVIQNDGDSMMSFRSYEVRNISDTSYENGEHFDAVKEATEDEVISGWVEDCDEDAKYFSPLAWEEPTILDLFNPQEKEND